MPWLVFARSQAANPTMRVCSSSFVFRGEDEYQVQFARELLQTTDVEYFILAHRHIPTRYELSPGHLFFNTGDWLENFSYITFGIENPEPMLHTIS